MALIPIFSVPFLSMAVFEALLLLIFSASQNVENIKIISKTMSRRIMPTFSFF